jgi:hypothetical protein
VSAEDLLRTALKLGDRQADELARVSRLAFRYRSALFRALLYARKYKIAKVIETIERELDYGREAQSDRSGSNVHRIDPGRAP